MASAGWCVLDVRAGHKQVEGFVVAQSRGGEPQHDHTTGLTIDQDVLRRLDTRGDPNGGGGEQEAGRVETAFVVRERHRDHSGRDRRGDDALLHLAGQLVDELANQEPHRDRRRQYALRDGRCHGFDVAGDVAAVLTVWPQGAHLDGGADAITQTIGGFTQAMTGDMSEVVGFLKAGEIRVLAVLTDDRIPGFESIPTAKEQGFDVVAVNWRGLYIPRGVSDDTFNMWAGRLQKVADSAEWKQAMAANGLAPFTKVGGDFQSYIDGVVAEVRKLSKELGVIQ